MKLLVVAGRGPIGAEGQAQLLCRQWATGLARRGHEVDALAVGGQVDQLMDGVAVRRLDAPDGRDGPHRYTVWLTQRAAGYDVVVFFDYAAPLTWAGLRAVAGRVATVLHPMATQRDRLHLSVFDTTLRLPTAYAFADREEDVLIADRLTGRRAGGVVGSWIDWGQTGDGNRFRRRAGLVDRPYLLCTGTAGRRLDDLSRLFVAYKARNDGPLAMVVLHAPPAASLHPDVLSVGPADDETARDAIAGALAVVEPFGRDGATLTSLEAWAQSRPVLVDRRRALLAELGHQSGGAIRYRGFAEFEAGVDLLVDNPLVGRALGVAGRRFVEVAYDTDRLLARYERLLRITQGSR